MNYFIRYLVVIYVDEKYGSYVCDLIKDVTKNDKVRIHQPTHYVNGSIVQNTDIRIAFWATDDAAECIHKSLDCAGIKYKHDMGVDAL